MTDKTSSFMTLQHPGSVSSATVLLDPPRCATGCQDSSIRIWDLSELKCIKTLKGHSRSVLCLYVDPDSRLLFSSANDKTIRVWKTDDDYQCVCYIPGLHGHMYAIFYSSGKLVVGSQDSSVTFCSFDVEAVCSSASAGRDTHPPAKRGRVSTEHLCSWTKRSEHRGMVFVFAFYAQSTMGSSSLKSEGGLLFSAGSDALIQVWSFPEMECRGTLHGHRGSVYSLAVGEYLFSGGQDQTVRVWDLETFLCKSIIKGHGAEVISLCVCIVSNDTQSCSLLCSGSANGSVRVWDECLEVLTEHSDSVMSLVGHESYLISASSDHTAKVWDLGADVFTAANPNRPRFAAFLNANVMGGQHGGGVSPVSSLDRFQSRTMNLTSSESAMIPLLRQFVAIPSVSGDSALRSECWRAAKFLQSVLHGIGADTSLVHLEDKNPILLGRLFRRESAITVLIYAHYDVHPAKKSDGWNSPPFMLTGRDGYLYGRGASDNKGPILAMIFAIRELMHEPNCPNFVFVFEGEGENGSGGFEDAIQQEVLRGNRGGRFGSGIMSGVFEPGSIQLNKNDQSDTSGFASSLPSALLSTPTAASWLHKVDVVLVSNNYWLGDETPCLTYGLRGCAQLAVTVRGPSIDLHSGMDGGAVREPMADLISVLGPLVARETGGGRVQLPGFYDGVREVSAEEEILLEEADFDVATYKRALALPALTADSGEALLRKRWSEPSLSVTAIRTSVDSDSIIPRMATARISMRTVPDQPTEALAQRIVDSLQTSFDELKSPNQLVATIEVLTPWWISDTHSSFFKAAQAAVKANWGTKPLLVREGGSSKVTPFLERVLAAPVLHFPLGQSSDRAHLPNERIRLKNLFRGKNVLRFFFQAISAPAGSGGASAVAGDCLPPSLLSPVSPAGVLGHRRDSGGTGELASDTGDEADGE